MPRLIFIGAGAGLGAGAGAGAGLGAGAGAGAGLEQATRKGNVTNTKIRQIPANTPNNLRFFNLIPPVNVLFAKYFRHYPIYHPLWYPGFIIFSPDYPGDASIGMPRPLIKIC